jgi:putative ABC transport system permease protein
MNSYADTVDSTAAQSGSRPPGTILGFGGGLWTLAVRNVLRQGTPSLLVGLLIAFGSLVLVLLSQFLGGVSHNFTRSFIDQASGDVYVSSKVERTLDRNVFDRTYEYFRLPDNVCSALTALPGFVSADERLDFDAKLITERDTLAYRVRAFDPESEPALAANFTLVEGRMFAAGEHGIVLPAGFARRHGIAVGDHVRLLAETMSKRVNVIDYVVTGTFHTTTLSAWFDTSAYINLSSARVLVDDPRALTRLNIHLADGAAYEDFAATLKHLLRTNRVAGNPALDATHWTEGAAYFVKLTEAMELGYAIIMIMVAVMIAAGLAFTTTMTIAKRTREIATLGALGAAPRTIRRLLLGENLLLAAGAAALGTACAGLVFLVTSRTGIPVGAEELRGLLGSAHFYPVFQARGFADGLSVPVDVAFVASYFLARRASRLPIAEAMAER